MGENIAIKGGEIIYEKNYKENWRVGLCWWFGLLCGKVAAKVYRPLEGTGGKKQGYVCSDGLGVMGQRLIKELRDSQVEVVYGIDKNEDMTYTGLDVIPIRGELPSVDAVVVTVVKEFETIREVLSKKIDCPVIAIEDILGVF